MSEPIRVPPPSAPDRRLAVAVGIVALTVMGVYAAYFLAQPVPRQVRDIPDDSFFYLQVARSFCDGNGFTFDGEALTYGFQPLWQLIVIALAAALGDGHALFFGTFLLCAALHAVTGYALFRLGARCCGVGAGLAAALLWVGNPDLIDWSCGLKENALYALLLAAAADRLVQDLREPPTRRRALAFGVVLGLMVFDRVNALAPAGALLAMFVMAFGLGGGALRRLQHVALATGVAALVAAPWYVFASFWFGTAMPTSGTWKLTLMRAQVELGWQTPWMSMAHVQAAATRWPSYLVLLFRGGFATFRGALGVAAVAGPALALWRRLSPRRTPLLPRAGAAGIVMLVALVGSAVVTSFANQMMLPGYLDYATWYAVPEFLSVAIVGGALLGACWRRGDGRVVSIAVLVLLAAATWLWPPRGSSADEALTAPPGKAQLVELGLWARRHMPDDARIGIWDPGIVAWFADRRLVSFDPLMNSLDYQRADIVDPVGYVQKRGVAYMIGVADRVGERWQYVPLPPGGYEVVWLPYPDRGVGFGGADGEAHAVLVRPLASPAAEFLGEPDFPCGVLYPDDPARRREVTRDRDRLLAGAAVAADVVRLWLELPATGPAFELRCGEQTVARFAPGANGFRGVDVRAFRGARLSVAYGGGDVTAVLRQAHLVDYSW